MHIRASVVFRICIVLALAGCESFQLEPPSQAQIREDSDEVVDDAQVLALVNSVDSAILLEERARRRNYRLLEKETLSGLGMVMLKFRSPAGLAPDAASRELEKLEPHATAGALHRYALETAAQETGQPRQQAPRFTPRLYANDMINWPAEGCAARFAVGMIDGPVDADAAGIAGADIVAASFIDAEPGVRAVNHGSAIAELIVGRGRLAEAQLYSAAVVDRNGAAVDAIIRAVNWMLDADVGVVNISLAGPYNKTLDRVVQRAADRGLVIVAAVGNDGRDATPRYPAAFESVIAVTAVDSAGAVYARAVSGDHVDFAAPGVDVFVKGDGRGRYVSGTSIAAPFVTTFVAGHAQAHDRMPAKALRALLGEETVDLGDQGHDRIYGRGLISTGANCRRI